MQSSQVRNVGLPSSAETKRDVPAWTQDPKIFPLDWFSVSRPNIIRQTKEYVSELSKWRNCPKIKTLSKLKAVLKRIMMFLHTHTSYIDGKSLLECDIEEDLITLVSLYMDMELRVLLIKKSSASGTTTGNATGSDTDTARNDKLVADRISYWLYTVLKGHEHRMDALLSTTVFTRHTRPVLDPIFRKILSEMSDGPFSNVNYVRHMLAYKTWRERALVAEDAPSEELNARVQQHLVPRDYVFPSPLLRCLGKGDNAQDHARPHNVNLADACRNFMRFCREMPAAAAEQINFGSIPLLDDDMLGDEENEVNKLMNMISERKQRKAGSPSLSPKRSFQQVQAFIDLTLPKSRMKSISNCGIPSTAVPDVIDLTEEDEKPIRTSRTSSALESPVAAPPRTAPAVQRLSASKKVLPPQDCSYALAPSTAQVETRRFTAFLDQDIILVNISCMCPQRRQRECQCQDKKVGYHKENKALKTSITERNYEKDTTFVGRCFQFSIGNQYPYPSEDDVDTEIGNSQDQVKMEMRPSAAVTCNTNEDEDESRDETTEFCDKLFSASLNHCDCDGCKPRDTNLSQYENRTCTSAESRGQSANELSDINVQCKQKPLVTCTQRVSHPTSVADMYAMEKTSPIVLQSQPSTSGSEDENRLEHFSETLDKRKIHLSENNKILKDNLIQSEKNLSNNSRNDIRKIKLPVVETVTDIRPDKVGLTVKSEDVFTVSTNITTRISEEITKIAISSHKSEDKFTESTNTTATVTSPNKSVSSRKTSIISVEDLTESTNVTAASTIFDKSTTHVTKSAEKISVTNAQYETTLHVSDTKTEMENVEYFTENINVTTGNAILDKSVLQEHKTSEKNSLSNAQNENLLHESDTRAEIEKLCSEISELGCSVLPDIENVIEKGGKQIPDEDLFQNKISTETLDSVREPMYEPVPDLTAVNIAEKHSESLELTKYVSTHHTDTSAEEVNNEYSNLSVCQAQFKENVNTDFEEQSVSHVIKKYNIEEDITNKTESTYSEYTSSKNSALIDFVEELASEKEIVTESELIIKSISDISTSLPVLNTINDNQVEREITIPSNPQHPFIESETKELQTCPIKTDNQIEQEELHIVQVETYVNIEEQELHTVQVETDVNIEEQELHIVPNKADEHIEQKLHTVQIETDVNIEQELHTIPVETEVHIEQEELHTVPVETDVNIGQQELHTVQVKIDVNIEQQELHTDQVETDVNIEQQELDTIPVETDDHIEQEELHTIPVETDVHIEREKIHTVQVESDVNIEQQELHRDQVETDVNIEQQELHTIPVETDVHIEREKIHTVQVESDVNIEQQELHRDQVETDVNIEQQELHTVQVETDVNIKQQELHTVQVENDVNIEQQELHTIPVETDVNIEQEELNTVQIETDVNIEQQELHTIPVETDVNIEQEELNTVQIETDVNIEQQELHTVQVENDVNIEQQELHTIPVETDVNIEQEELNTVQIETDVNIEQQELHTVQVETDCIIDNHELFTVSVETDVYIEQEEIHTVQVGADVNIEQQELLTVQVETDGHTEPEELHTVQVGNDVHLEQQELHTGQIKTDVNIDQQKLYTVQVETDVNIEQQELHAVHLEPDVNIQEQELHTVPVETDVYIEQEELHIDQVETNMNIEEKLFTVAEQDLHTGSIGTDVILEQELYTVPIELDVVLEQELQAVSKETCVFVEQELQTVPIEKDIHVEQDLHTDPIEKNDYTNLPDTESKANNIRKQISLVSDTLRKKISIYSRNDTVNGRNLSPRKRRRRKTELVTDESANENELKVSLLEKSCQQINDANNVVLGTSKRRKSRSLDEIVINKEKWPEPELIQAIKTKYETTPEITISATYEENTLNTDHLNMPDLTKEISTDKNKMNDEKPKRRRKQNFKNVREDKTVLTTTKNDKSASTTENKDKELYIVCKNLTQTEIEFLRTNREESLSDNNVKLSRAEVDENKINPRKKNQVISNLTSNIIEGTESQPTKLIDKEDKQTKTNLNSKQKNNLIDDGYEITSNKNTEEITFQLNNSSIEKKNKIKVKSRRKSQPVENKIMNKTIEDQVSNSPINKTREIISDGKVRRSRGRPPKIIANKLKFFSENFNLQNLGSRNTKFFEPDNNLIEKVNSVKEMDIPLNLEVTEEDLPLAYRMSQTLSQKRNSFKSVQLDTLSDVENKSEKSEDELPLSTRKQKLNSSQSHKNEVFMKFHKKPKLNNSKNIENLNKINKEPITKNKLFRSKLEQFKFQPRNKDELLENNAIQEEDTFSLKKFNTGNKSRKYIKTYSNTKTLKTPELFSVPDIIQMTRKPKKSRRFSDDEITIINYLETDLGDCSDISVITKSVLEDQQLRATKAFSDNKNVENSLSSAEKIKIKKSRKVSGESLSLSDTKTPEIADINIFNAVQLIEDRENKTKTDDLVIEVIITESKNPIVENEDVNISTENTYISSATVDTIQLCASNPEFVEEITDNLSSKEKLNENTKVEKEDIKSSQIVTSECNKLFTEANKVNIDTCTEPVTSNSHVFLMPKKILSKKARDKLFVTEIKKLSGNKMQEKLDTSTETEISESKNILRPIQFQENLCPNNDTQEFPTSLSIDNKTADIVNIEQETSTNKQEKLTFESSETITTDEKDSSLTQISSLSSDTASENTVVGINKSVKFPVNENFENKDNEFASKENTHQSPKIRKSKFPKLKLKMNNKNNLYLLSKSRNHIKSLPKLKSQFGKKKNNKIQVQLHGSNYKKRETLLSKVRKFKQSRGKKSAKRTKSNNKNKSVEQCSDSSFHVEEDCKNVSQIVDEHSLKFIETSKSIVNVKESFEEINMKNISKKKLYLNSIEPVGLAENIPLITEENKQNITEDIKENPCNKIYEKDFDFYSDQDDVSNSELVIDTSAESSDAEEPAVVNEIKENKNDHQLDSEITVTKQAKYHHSIAEIVHLNEQNTPESNCYIENNSNNNEINNVAQENEVNTVDPSGIQTLIQVNNEINGLENILNQNDIIEHQIDNIVNISTSNQIIDENTLEGTKVKTVIVEKNITEHQKSDICIGVPYFSSIPIIEETVVNEMIVGDANIVKTTEDIELSTETINDLKEDTVSEVQTTTDLKENKNSEEHTKIQNTAEEPNEIQKIVENKKIILEERISRITEISDEISNELYTEVVIEEKVQQLIESFAPTVEMFLNIEVGFESCTFSQKKPIEGKHVKESCVKCSVNGKHKNNKKVTVRGIHQYQQINVDECLEENANIPTISCCQAVESFEPNPCNLTAKVESVQILTNDNPALDNYNLCILADIAMNSVHLNTKTENNVMEVIRERSHEISNQNPIRKDERCFFVAFPEKMPDSNKPGTSLSIINSNNEEMSVNVQKLAGGLNPKGTVLENKIQALTERAKNGTRINGENLDELCKSLENMCELEINTLTRIPKLDCQNNILSEPNISIDIPNTALLHLTPDDDDFMIRNEPFSLQTPILQSLSVETAPKAPENKADFDTTGVVKKLCNVIESVTNDQKVSSENENSDCNVPKEEQETKTKLKKGKVKSKSLNNQSSETSYMLNKYKSNLDSNKNTEVSNQQTTNNKNAPSPPSYIRSTRPMRMVTTRKRNINVLDNSCPPNEPVKKVSVSEKMFDKLLEEHRKELSETKSKEEITIDASTESSCMIKNTTMPVLDDNVPETNVLTAPITQAEELNIPLPVLQYQMSESQYQMSESELRNAKITSNTEPIKLDPPIGNIEELQKEDNSTEKIDIEPLENLSLAIEIHPINEKLPENILNSTEIDKLGETSEENSLNKKETIKKIMSDNIEVNTHTEAQTEKDKDEQIVEEEVSNTTDRNASAIEVVQDWFNRVDKNKAQTEPYAEITSYQTIEECNFFEDSSSTIENSPNVRKIDEKVFSEHQTPDSGIAFDEDSVQKDKSLDSQTPVPENLSDVEISCTPEPEPVTIKTYFCNLNEVEAENVHKQDEIADLQVEKPKTSSEVSNMKLKVSIALERIQDILPMLTKHKIPLPERKMKKRKECATDFDQGMKRKHSSVEEEMVRNPVAVQDFDKTLLKDYKIKRRKHSIDDSIVQECIVEEVVSPAPSQKDVPSTVRTKGSVKEYPDCLFGITESPVPSGSFNSPYPSDISLTEEPTFYEEEGIDLCNDYPCYDSFEVLQEQQSLQKEYNVVDDNPKDVQQGLQAGYCVVDSQFLPLSEYMNDGDYILIDNKIFNDKRMVPVNMHQVQPEFKPHTDEVKRSEFDDSEKEDSLSETVDEIIKNPNLFPEQSTSEVQVINMDQATSEVQVVIACDTFQETEMTDTYLFGIAIQNEHTSCDTTSTSTVSDTQHATMNLEGATPESKVTNKPVDFKPATPVMGSENTQFCNTSVVPVADLPQPVSMELLTAVESISEPVITQDIENNEEQKDKKLTDTSNMELKIKTRNRNTDIEKEENKSKKLCTQRLSCSESPELNVPASKTPLYSPSTSVSNSTIHSSSPTQTSPRIFTKPCYSKSSNEKINPNGDEVFENKITKDLEPKMSDTNNSASSISNSSYKNLKKYNYNHGTKISNEKSPHLDQRLHNDIQKPFKKYDSTTPSKYLSPPLNQKRTDPKMYPKQYHPKSYNSNLPMDAFDKLKQDRTDRTPPRNTHNRYQSSSSSNLNFMKNRYRKDTLPVEKRISERDSPKRRHITQIPSDLRRPQSAYTESSPKSTYRLPPSDPTHRSSQYNSKIPDVKPPQSRNTTEQNRHNQSSTSSQAHKDWLKNETLLNLIKTANTIYNKKY